MGAPQLAEDGEIDAAQYATATNMVIIQQVASISRLQRMLNIGYNAAARMIERMEAEGIVGPMRPDGKRDVLRPSPIAETVDPLFQSALDIIVRNQKVNVRMLKTDLKIGTTKALELIAKLEQAGKVSTCDERGG
ncbi:MAG: DNA translocase FtsK, partial [Rhodoferax sp.]